MATRRVIAERDLLNGSGSTSDGSIPDPGDRQEVQAYDDAIGGWAELPREAGMNEWTATRRAIRARWPDGISTASCTMECQRASLPSPLSGMSPPRPRTAVCAGTAGGSPRPVSAAVGPIASSMGSGTAHPARPP